MKEAKSSIHIEAGNISVLKHNDRSIPTINAIFNDEANEYDITGSKALQKYHRLLKPRIEAYTKRTGQKLNKRTITHLSSIVNIKKTTTMKELRRLAIRLEILYGTRVFQIAIHRDEGHIKDGQNIKNYHAHLEMLGLDRNGYSIRRKLTRKSLSKLQDITAEILQMQRGTNYAKEKKKRPKRLGTYEYKRAMEIKENAINNVKKEFQIIIEQREQKIKRLALKVDEVSTQLKTVTEQKKSVDSALTELLPQLQLRAVRGKRYSYSQIKDLVLDKFKELNGAITQLKQMNKEYQQYLLNAKQRYAKLQNKNIQFQEKIELCDQNIMQNKEIFEDKDEEVENSLGLSC